MRLLKEVPNSIRKEVTFQMVVALRDTLTIAKKTGIKPTYENAIRIFYDFSPELWTDIVTNLPQRNVSEEAQLIIVQAAINGVTPLEELDSEVKKYSDLLAKGASSDEEGTILDEDKINLIKNKIVSLQRLRKSLRPRDINENRILQRDFSKANRKDLGAKLIEGNDFHVDYKLTKNKYLRLRLLHPDKPEHVTGADMIYEQHDTKKGLIRVMFLQYKIWEKGVLHFSRISNLQAQIDKLIGCLCNNGYCNGPILKEGEFAYRFPHCSAFLRPTDKLQEDNEKLVSTGIHIPICQIPKLKAIEGDKLEKKYLKYSALNQDIFEYLFNREFVGSRWIPENEIEAFYKQNRILLDDETVKFYAREIFDPED